MIGSSDEAELDDNRRIGLMDLNSVTSRIGHVLKPAGWTVGEVDAADELPEPPQWTTPTTGWPSSPQVAAVVAPSLAPIVVGVTFGSGQQAFAVALLVAIAVLAASLYALRAQPVLLFATFFLWLAVERFGLAAISPRLDGDSLRWLLSYKELFFPLALLVLLPRVVPVWRSSPRLLRFTDGLAVAFAVLVVVGFLLSDAPLMDRLVNGRRLVLLPLVYGVARLLPWRPSSTRSMLAIVVIGGVAVSLFGLLERSLLEHLVWRQAIPAAYYYHLSSNAGLSATGTDFPVSGLPKVFHDFTFGFVIRRLVSTFLEATTVASFLALATIVALVGPWSRRWRVAAGIVIGTATILTLSKAGWAILGISLAYLAAATIVPRLKDPAWLLSMAATLLGALVVIAVVLESTGLARGPLAHFDGFKEGIESGLANPLGVGVGFGGNFGASKLGAESSFGVTIVQLGWIGLAIWSAWMLSLIVATARLGSSLRSMRTVALGVAAALTAFFGTAAMTESAGGLLGNWLYAMVAGGLVTAASHAGRSRGPSTIPTISGDGSGQSRPRSEWAVMIGGPVAINLVLAVLLFATVPRVAEAAPNVFPDVDSGAATASALPRSDPTDIIDEVERRTGHRYDCSSEWLSSDGLRNWACRTNDALAILRGRTSEDIANIETTWFGFDRTATDLPGWAAAAATDPEEARLASDWVDASIGTSATTASPHLDLTIAIARGADSLSVLGR